MATLSRRAYRRGVQHYERRARIAAGVLVAATLMFFIGVTAERLPTPAQPVTAAQPTPAQPSESADQVACERAGGSEESCAKPAAASAPSARVGAVAAESQEGSPEREAAERAASVQEATLFGLPVESPPVIGLVVTVSLILAAAMWFRPRVVWVLLVAIGFALVTGAFDLREIPFQAARADLLLVALAVLAGILHLAAAVMAGAAARQLMTGRAALQAMTARGGQHATGK